MKLKTSYPLNEPSQARRAEICGRALRRRKSVLESQSELCQAYDAHLESRITVARQARGDADRAKADLFADKEEA